MVSAERAVRVRAPGRGHCVVFLARHSTLTVPISTQEYKWVLANCRGNLTNCGEVTYDGLTSRPAASCYKYRDKLRTLWPRRLQGFTSHYNRTKQLRNILRSPRVLTKTPNWPNIPKNWPQLRFWKRVSSSYLSPMDPAVVFGSVVF